VEACSRSVERARVLREGCTTSVAARARCCGGGTKAGRGVGDEVPATRRLRRRVRAWMSFVPRLVSWAAARMGKGGGGGRYRVLLRSR